MPDEPDPPRKFYELKPRDFERANQPRSGAEPGFHPAEPQIPEQRPDRIDVRDLHRQAAVPGPVLSTTRPQAANEVKSLLRANQAKEEAAGLYRVSPPPERRSRRKRDYWLVVLTSNTVFGALAIAGWTSRNPVLFVYSVAAMGLITASVTWVMFHIMEDY